jgi:hypothetical protein
MLNGVLVHVHARLMPRQAAEIYDSRELVRRG